MADTKMQADAINMNTLPTTDDEATARLRLMRKGLAGETMARLFCVRRKRGEDLLTAYVAAIRASLPAHPEK